MKITPAGVTTTYLDNGQVLDGGRADSGHCLNGTFVSGRMDESHSRAQIGASSPVAPSARPGQREHLLLQGRRGQRGRNVTAGHTLVVSLLLSTAGSCTAAGMTSNQSMATIVTQKSG